jgi:hypothetical protein
MAEVFDQLRKTRTEILIMKMKNETHSSHSLANGVLWLSAVAHDAYR